MPKKKTDKIVEIRASPIECQCPISYHVEKRRDGHLVAVWDEPPPSVMHMCFGRCERCGLPYHTEFTRDEPV
jgi:hypothetical protein